MLNASLLTSYEPNQNQKAFSTKNAVCSRQILHVDPCLQRLTLLSLCIMHAPCDNLCTKPEAFNETCGGGHANIISSPGQCWIPGVPGSKGLKESLSRHNKHVTIRKRLVPFNIWTVSSLNLLSFQTFVSLVCRHED